MLLIKSSILYLFITFMDLISWKTKAEVSLNFGKTNNDDSVSSLMKEIQVELIEKLKQKCNHLNLIFDTNSINDELNVHETESSMDSTALILNLNPSVPPSCLNEFKNGEIHPPSERPFASCSNLTLIKFSIKFPPSCSLIIMSIHPKEEEITNLRINYNLWSFIKFPGIPFQIFYFFLVQDTLEDVEMDQLKIQLISNFSMATRKIPHVLYFLKKEESLMTRSNSNDGNLNIVGSLKGGILKMATSTSGYSGLYQRKKKYRDFNGDKVLVIIYPVANNYEVSKETGSWEDFIIATMHFTFLLFNASMEIESAFDIPRDGVTEDEQWDIFMTPILDGSAIYSAILRATPKNFPFAQFSKPILFDGATFISALPKRAKPASVFSVLRAPLSFEIWIITAITLILTFIMLEILCYIKTRQNTNHYRILIAILNPLIEQTGISRYCRNIIKDSTSRSILGLWFLSLIVLGCGYKSSLFDIIVSPRYSKPPSNFYQLLDSDYEIGGIAWTNLLGLDFDMLLLKDRGNVTMGHEIGKRMTEYDFTTPDCYLSIFEGKRVCIGYSVLFTSLALEYNTDVNGRLLHMKSDDRHFVVFPSLAISKDFPDFTDPLNWIIGVFEAHGIHQHWLSTSRDNLKSKGKLYAKRNYETKPHYKGSGTTFTDQQDDDSGQFRRLLQIICRVGCGISTISFILEVFWTWYKNKKRRMRVDPFQSDSYGFVN